QTAGDGEVQQMRVGRLDGGIETPADGEAAVAAGCGHSGESSLRRGREQRLRHFTEAGEARRAFDGLGTGRIGKISGESERSGSVEVLHGGRAEVIEHQRVSGANAGLLV